MRPIAVVHDEPEAIAIKLAQIGDDCDSYILGTLVMQRTCEMMVINDVIPAFWTTSGDEKTRAVRGSAG